MGCKMASINETHVIKCFSQALVWLLKCMWPCAGQSPHGWGGTPSTQQHTCILIGRSVQTKAFRTRILSVACIALTTSSDYAWNDVCSSVVSDGWPPSVSTTTDKLCVLQKPPTKWLFFFSESRSDCLNVYIDMATCRDIHCSTCLVREGG